MPWPLDPQAQAGAGAGRTSRARRFEPESAGYPPPTHPSLARKEPEGCCGYCEHRRAAGWACSGCPWRALDEKVAAMPDEDSQNLPASQADGSALVRAFSAATGEPIPRSAKDGDVPEQLVVFLVVLMRDHLPVSKVHEIIEGHDLAGKTPIYHTPELAALARRYGARLV